MNRTSTYRRRATLWATIVLATPVAAASVSAQSLRLGEIDFPNSGAPEAQDDFLDGVLLLHSFEFADAARAFRRAQDTDPDFALAYWGEAMTYYQPSWRTTNRVAGGAALARLDEKAGERLARYGTEVEQLLVEQHFGR